MTHLLCNAVYRRICTGLLAGIITAATPICVLAQTMSWVRTVEGCTMWEALRNPTATVSSNIPCKAGKLDGEGTIKYFDRGHQYWEWQISEKRGARLVDGILRAAIDSNVLSFKVPFCGSIPRADVTVSSQLAFEMFVVKRAVDSLAREAYTRQCHQPAPRLGTTDRFDLMLYSPASNGGEPKWIGWAEDYGRNYTEYWRTHELELIKNQQKANEQEAAKRSSAVRLEKRQQLAKTYGTFQVTTLQSISPNPYVWKGKLVGLCVMFDRMLNESTAEMHGSNFIPVSVTGVPSTRFRTPGVVFLLAQVTGQNNGSTSLLFRTAIDQPRDDNCSDFIDR